MAAKYFTADEANEALSVVRPLAEEMVERRRVLADLQERHAAFTTTIAGNGGDFDPGELHEVEDQMGEEATAVARCVARINEVGAFVKDLDRGLVDFPARRDGEDVLLCWQVGEEDVAFWHGLEEGFSGRKPLPL
ncbi:MAG: DUF2203 domain-containing protein [Gaiellaceae bacterium]